MQIGCFRVGKKETNRIEQINAKINTVVIISQEMLGIE